MEGSSPKMPAVAAATPPKAVGSAYKLNARQKAVAAQIVDAGHKAGSTNEEIIAALSVGISESGLDPTAVGDGGSAIGVFQQHPSYGSTTVRQDVAAATTAFLTQLKGLRTKNVSLGVKAADVQRPAAAYRGIYGQNLDEALNVYNQVSGSPYAGTVADLTGNPSTLSATGSLVTVDGKQFDSGFAPFVTDLIAKVKGLTITSGLRSTQHNKDVGGVTGSQHLTGTAVDVVPTTAADKQAIVDQAAQYGLEYIDEGDHIHIELPNVGISPDGRVISTDKAGDTPYNVNVNQTAPGVYKALDNVLNNRGGFIDQLNPVTDARVLVARGMFAVGGITLSVFGLILIVGAVATKSGATKVGKLIPPITPATAAVSAASTVAEAVGD